MKGRDTAISTGVLILRVAFGCMMLVHGWQKLTGFSEKAEEFPDPLGMGNQLSLISAIAAEVGCSLLIIVGLGTRLAAIPLAFTMIVALYMIHGADPWQTKELAAVYLAAFVALVFTGPGCFSLDQFIWKRKRDHKA